MTYPVRPLAAPAALLITLLLLGGCADNSNLPAALGAPAPRPYPIATPAAAPRALNVMTVNLQHKDRPEELAVVARHLKASPATQPDFVLCQEVQFGRGGAEDSTAEVLARHLGYDVRTTKRTSDGEGVAILSRYPIEYYDAINLKSQTLRILLGFRRVSNMAEVTVPGVGRVRLVNVHFTNWGFEQHVRRAQLRETLEWAAKRDRAAPAALTFLGGDFNARPDDDEMKLVTDPAVTAPLAFTSWNGSTPSMGSYGDPDKRIDFIFVSARDANAPGAARHPLQFAGENLLWKDGVPVPGKTDEKFYLSDHLALVHKYDLAAPTPSIPAVATPATPARPIAAKPAATPAKPAAKPAVTGVPTGPIVPE